MKTDIETEQLRKYREVYTPEMFAHTKPQWDYFSKMCDIKIQLLKEYCSDKEVLDLCCGGGDFSLPAAQFAKKIIGIDFSPEMVSATVKKLANCDNATAIIADATSLPFESESFDSVFSYSSLYCIPDIEAAIKEVARVLRIQGIAVLDFGILASLNTLVCRAYEDECAIPCHIKLDDMYRMLDKAGFKIIQNRAFQILPYWGNKPKYLKPLLLSFWKSAMQKTVFGKMLDEWICKTPIIGRYAFRRIVVCQKQ